MSDPIPQSLALEMILEFRLEHDRIRAMMPDRVNNPVWFELVDAYCSVIQQLIPALLDVHGSLPEDCDLLDKYNELRSWLFDDGRNDDKPGPFADMLTRHGFSYTQATELLEVSKDSKKGAPRKRRKAFVDAYQMSLSASQWAATQKYCDCGKKHDRVTCKDAMVKGMKQVERLLAKYSPKK